MKFDSTKWAFIEAMKFNERGYKGAGDWLVNESGLSQRDMNELEKFFRSKKSELYDKLFGVEGVGDDGFDDLLSQIVANGEDFYNNITIERAQKMIDNDEFTESFSYAFHHIPVN